MLAPPRTHRRSPSHLRAGRVHLEPIRQDGPAGCASACLRMVARHFGREIDPDEVDRLLYKDAAGCSFNTDLARIALRHGLRAECYGYNLYLNDPADAALSGEGLLGTLRERQGSLADRWYAPMLRSIVDALDAGVAYRVRKPVFDTAAAYLRERVPVIAVVSYPALYGERGNPFSGHDVVLTGCDARRVLFVDPLDGQEHSVSRAHFMFALHSRSAIGTSDYFTVLQPA